MQKSKGFIQHHFLGCGTKKSGDTSKKSGAGFTLIELLVVIAIIGILSAIVFVNVNSARKSAKDAAVQANLSQMQVAAEQIYTANGKYTTVCDATSTAGMAFAAANSAVAPATGTCKASDTAYSACIPLVNASTNAWCVDNSGIKKQITTANCSSLTTTACP